MSNPYQDGGCSCGKTRYRLQDTALIVHACHCTMCQRLSGSTNAINVLIEADKTHLLSGETTETLMPTPSGHGQVITRCKSCRVAIWSAYQRFSKVHGVPVRFVRAGTLDQPATAPPDVHIFTDSKLDYVTLADGKPQFGGFYDVQKVWSRASLARLGHRSSGTGAGAARVETSGGAAG